MRCLITVFIFCLGTGMAAAQTSLTLSVTGANVAQPDQVVASFTAQATAASAAAAQAALNRLMVKALAETAATTGVIAETGGYNVDEIDSQTTGTKTQFQASQELDLTVPAAGGTPPTAFSALAGDLQSQGLLLESLSASLSANGRDAARAAATQDAIIRLRAQANAVAKTLGEVVAGITTLTINNSDASPVMPRGMMAMAAAPVPQLAPGPVTISTTIDATLALKPPGE